MTRKGRTRPLLWGLVGVLGVTGAAFGYWGWSLAASSAHPLDLVYWTAQLFNLEGGPLGDLDQAPNWQVLVARVLAPAATFGAVVGAVLEFLSWRLERWRIRKQRGHTVVCGLGSRGRAFALSERAAGRDVVVIETAQDADETFCAEHDLRLLHGDTLDEEILSAAAVPRAARLVLATGSDTQNVAAAMVARRLVATRGTRTLKVFAAIEDAGLWNTLTHSNSVRRRSKNFEFTAFNLAQQTARRFFWDWPLYRYAERKDQSRIHAVFLGFGAYGQNLLVQLPLACTYRDLDNPAVTVLSPEPALESARLEQHYPEIREICDIVFEPFDLKSRSLDEATMAAVEKRSGVTAVFVCLEPDDAALRAAIHVRDAMARNARWRAPVFVRMSRPEGIEGVLDGAHPVRRLEDLAVVFGADREHCGLELIDGGVEETAREFHQAYRETLPKRIGEDAAPEKEESRRPWEELEETYRQANRRAVDHIKAKIESAGCRVPPGLSLVAPEGFSLAADEELREALAALEHHDWSIERRLEGWRPGKPRDNTRKIHDSLPSKPGWGAARENYEKLDEADKEQDRKQIELIDDQLIKRGTDLAPGQEVIRHDHWIGLIGRLQVTVEEAEWVREVLSEEVLPSLVTRNQAAHFTLLSPLAPGLDLVMTQSALDAMSSLPHHLLVVEGVPESHMLDDFEVIYEAGATWNGKPRLSDERWNDSLRPESAARGRIAAARAEVIANAACEWVIDLTAPPPVSPLAPGVDYEREEDRQEGYRKAGDYIARKCHSLMAATRSDSLPRPGGVTQTLADRARAFQSAAGAWPRSGDCSTIILELDTRRVHVLKEASKRVSSES